jgi:putative endonuclease
MTNITNNVLYTGVTGNLKQRVHQHKHGQGGQFTRKYCANKLVYFEVTNEVSAALAREKQIKAGSRQKKLDLINAFNPEWRDLYSDI